MGSYHCDKCGAHFPLCEVCEQSQAVTEGFHGATLHLCCECARKLTIYLRGEEDYRAYLTLNQLYNHEKTKNIPSKDLVGLFSGVLEMENKVIELIHKWIKDNRKSNKAKVLHLTKKEGKDGKKSCRD